MDDNKKALWRQRIGLYGGVIAMLLVCWVFIWAYRTITIRRYGAELVPKAQVARVEAAFHAMGDEMYADDTMGDTGYTMGEQGSLLCALSMAASAKGLDIGPEKWNLPELYKENVYQVDQISRIEGLEKAKFEAYTSFAEDKVREILKAGDVCLARIIRSGNVHWVCIVGTEADSFLMLDPAGSGETEPLTEKVYALGRLIIRK